MDLHEMAEAARKKNAQVIEAHMETLLKNRRDAKAAGVVNLRQPTNIEIYQSISTMPGNPTYNLYNRAAN